MLSSDVFMIQPLSLLRAIGKHRFRFMTKRQVDGGRYFFAKRGMRFNLLADGFDRRTGAEEAIGQGLILPQQAEQQVLSFNARTAELAGFIPGEEDYPAGLFGITFKHNSCPVQNGTDSED